MAQRLIPFEIPNVNFGLVEVKGLLHIKKDELLLEFNETDAFGGLIKSELREISIPFDEIDSIHYKKGMFSSKIEIVGKSMRSLMEVPGSDQGRSTLKVKRKNREAAEKALSAARLSLSEYKLNQLGE